ncbi:ABC transporter substrate-binding protein [Microbacterium sp.]|uniref:ABC transporter substrate-binding protein n=1 Tax=Microbacterium sp. TaxID=51671 RepID=UPI0028AC7A7C|nr:ABC transporter substrate-binding protein [Microbacterium sp.]
MNRRKALTLSLTGIVATGALALTGCAAGEGASADGKDGQKVVYVVPSSWAQTGAFADNVKAWEKESGNTVEIQAIPDEQYDDTVRARLQGGEGIDIYAGQDNVDDPSAIMREVDESEFGDRMADSVLESMRAADGKIYGYPAADGLSSFGVIYNKDVLTSAATAAPKTLDEFTAALETVKAEGVTPLYLSGADGWTLLQHRNSVNANLLGQDPELAKQLAANKTTWGDVSEMEPQYAALAGWASAGLTNSDVLTAKYETAIKSVADGTAGAIINGSWAIGEIRKANPDANIGFFALPTTAGENQVALSRPNTLHIAAASKVEDAAADLLQFLITPENVAAHLAAAPGIPAFTDVELENPDAAIADIQTYVENGQSGAAFDTAIAFPTPESELIAAYQELVGGRIDAAGFVKKVDAAWQGAGKTAGIKGF